MAKLPNWFWALALAWLAFFVWTVTRLWRPIDSQYSKVIQYFVRVEGLGGSVVFPIAMSQVDWRVSDPDFPRFVFVATALIGPPLWLWAGYFSGRMLAYLIGVRPDS